MTEVFVGVAGGLGNQMFQAAFAIALERRFGVEVRLLADRQAPDAFGYGRRYLLDRFPFVDVRTASPDVAAAVPVCGEAGANEETLATLFSAEGGSAPMLCFTDEPLFASFIFRDIPDHSIVQPNRNDPLHDRYLLSQCRDFVIANSSFSWWAAWLGARPDSIVYAPRPRCVFDPALSPAPTRWRRIENAVLGM